MKEEPVASFILREDGELSVRELLRFGLRPFKIKAVRVLPRNVDVPSVKSDAASIAIIGVEAIESTLPSFKIKLQNVSFRDVLALSVELRVSGTVRGSSMPQGKEGRPLIAAGATYDLIKVMEKAARPMPQGYQLDTPPHQEVVITTANFADGTFEGNAVEAAGYKGFIFGRRLAGEKLLELIRNLLSSPVGPTTSAIERLKAQISALPSEVDIVAVDDVVKDMPTFTAEEKSSIKTSIDVGLHGVKMDFLKELQRFIDDRTSGPKDVRAWLRRSSERYEKWISMASIARIQ